MGRYALAATVGGLACALYTSWPVSFFVTALSFTAYVLARAKAPLVALIRAPGRSA